MIQVRLRHHIMVMAVAVCSPVGAAAPAAGWSPERNIEIVVPASPGGGFDRPARALQQLWQDAKITRVPVSVLNKPGGGGAVSWAYIKSREGDGGALCISTPNILLNGIMRKSMFHYAEFTPIAQLYTEYPVAMVRTESPLRTGQDLVKALQANPESVVISVGSGYGNVNHLAMVLVAKHGGTDPKKLRTVVFKGSNEVVTALLGGHIEVAMVGAGVSLPHLAAGKVRILGISAPQRLSGPLAEVPTWKEQQVDSVIGNWRGIIGAPGMKRAQTEYWDGVFRSTVDSPEWKKLVASSAGVPEYLDSSGTGASLKSQHAELSRLLTELGLAR